MDLCECGEAADIYMDIEGNPLDEPLCYDCWFFEMTCNPEKYIMEEEEIDGDD